MCKNEILWRIVNILLAPLHNNTYPSDNKISKRTRIFEATSYSQGLVLVLSEDRFLEVHIGSTASELEGQK